MSEIILLTHTVITILGFGGLIYWMNRQMNALTGAVNAQEQTIKAQAEHIKSQSEIFKEFESLINTIKMLSDITDSPKMLERWKAHKDLLEEEMKAKLDKHIRVVNYDIDRLKGFSKFSENLYIAFVEAMLYAPIPKRKKWINSIFTPSSFLSMSEIDGMKSALQEFIEWPIVSNEDDYVSLLVYTFKESLRRNPPIEEDHSIKS